VLKRIEIEGLVIQRSASRISARSNTYFTVLLRDAQTSVVRLVVNGLFWQIYASKIKVIVFLNSI
jgi:hypothetical protein